MVSTPRQTLPRLIHANVLAGWWSQSSVSSPRPTPFDSTTPVPVHATVRTDSLLDSYPKHVWSPAGGWYAQPSNWKVNTAVFGVVILGFTALTWRLSADREFRHKMPEPGRFYPSR